MKHPKDNGVTRIEGRAWPTTTRRPGETTTEWCRRLDSYQYEAWDVAEKGR